MLIEPGEKSANLHRAAGLVAKAAGAGAQVAVLPEAMPLGWTHSSARILADAIPGGESCQVLQEMARRHGIYLCSGLVEKEGGSLFNAAVLINPQGEIVLHHRKINELDIAQDLYGSGNCLGVARTPFGTFGLMICADAFARGQVISRALGRMGADVILSPCAWAVPAEHENATEPYGKLWLDNYQPVARDFRLWIAGVSNVGWLTDGPWKGRKCIGCSLVVNPAGESVLVGPYGPTAEAVLYLEVKAEPRPASGDGWEKFWNGP